MTNREIREVWIGRDKDRHYYQVSPGGAIEGSADDEAVVMVNDLSEIRCLRCDVSQSVEFKCIHIHTVRKTLDL